MLSLRLAACLALFATRGAFGQGPAPSPLFAPGAVSSPVPSATPSMFPSPAPALERADLEPFLDGLINSQLENRDIAGAVVAVVKDGQVLLEKGYGYADFAQRKPVDAKGTLFRPGSISKLFTATAVMQLVEQGKLDLDRDVRDYLDFEIPRNFPEPITLRRILTHTAGFEESVKDLFASGNSAQPLRDYLISHIPGQIFRPGTVPAYSNYALSLAGYIVERASGEGFERYVDEHIFKPLEMTSSTFEQPLPPAFAPRMSAGYLLGSKAPKPFEICNPAPAGALSTTAEDMSRFMLAYLNDGTLGSATILQPDSVHAMQSRQFELHPQLHAMGLTFIEYSQNGHTIWGHAGDTFQFHSDLWLIPDAHVGVFISYNSAGNRPGSGRSEVFRSFLDRYFPESPTRPIATEGTVERNREVAGVYETSRRSETNVLRITGLLGQIAVTAEGSTLKLDAAKNARGQTKVWREVAPLLYEEVGGPDQLAFRRDQNGKVTEMLPNMPIATGQRVSGLSSKSILLPLIGISFGFIFLTLLLWPVAAIVRKGYGRAVWPDRTGRILHLVARLVCLLLVGMIAVFAFPFSKVNDDVGYLGSKIDPWLQTSHMLGWIGSLGVLVIIVAAVRSWRTDGVGAWARVHATLLACAAIVCVVFAWQFHLLSASLKF
ncbi:MAG: beta-lactamase family protein [Verrucomicrobiota bacterium]|nr:beta-lactamase family protein [Verrucomicrobiota bacterium]